MLFTIAIFPKYNPTDCIILSLTGKINILLRSVTDLLRKMSIFSDPPIGKMELKPPGLLCIMQAWKIKKI